MSRLLLCLQCGKRMCETAELGREGYRFRRGPIKLDGRMCDLCAEPFEVGTEVACFTMHPEGPQIVKRWEHEYLSEVRGVREKGVVLTPEHCTILAEPEAPTLRRRVAEFFARLSRLIRGGVPE